MKLSGVAMGCGGAAIRLDGSAFKVDYLTVVTIA
jgi:hypothetical protein